MPTTVSSRLDTKQTTVHFAPIDTYGDHLRHSCSQEVVTAAKIYDLLDDRKDKKRSERLLHCRDSAWFYRHEETGEVRVGSNACSLRWCPVCARTRRNYISHVVGEWIPKQVYPKFLTLTLRHSEAPLDWQIKSLYKYFRELRRRKEFAKCVTGGIWFFQIKKSKTDNLWHPHLHCIITGLYLAKRKLHKMWCQVTHGSFVADIRGIEDPKKAANDAARYAACPGSLMGLSLADGCELVGATYGRRICGTWGTGRTVSLRPAKSEDADKWRNVGSWYSVMSELDNEPNARAILYAWKHKEPLDKDATMILSVDLVDSMVKELMKDFTWDEIYTPERSPP